MRRLNGGFIVVITGGAGIKTGTGKSYTAMKIGESVDKSFNASKMCITPVEFLTKLKEVEDSKEPYQCVVLDETEIVAGNRSWTSLNNRLIDFSMMIVRNIKCMIIFVTPHISLIDKQLRMLAVYWGACRKVVDSSGNTRVKMSFYKVKTDKFTGNVYYERLKFYEKDTGKVAIGNDFDVSLPSPALVAAYEERITAFKSRLRDEFLARAKSVEKDEFSQLTQGSKYNYKENAEKIYNDQYIRDFFASGGDKVNDALLISLYPDLNTKQAEVLARVVNVFYRRDKLKNKAVANVG